MINVINFFKKHQLVAECNTVDNLQQVGYTIEKTIGKGTYSKVCLCRDTKSGTNEKLACKIINKKCAGTNFINKFLPRELKIISNIKHPNIVKIHEILEIHHNIYIFMDYCANGDLLEYIKIHGPLSQEKAKVYFRQMVNAVKYLHDMNIAHRDLKCENILLTFHNNIKICDFGFARNCIDSFGEYVFSNTFCGSAAYAPPEILQGVEYDPKMYDMWSLGCILYIMLTTSMPYDDTNVRHMLKCQLNRSLNISTISHWKKNCRHLKSLIAYLLEPDVIQRATIDQVVHCDWLKETNTKPRNIGSSFSEPKIY